MYMHTQKKKRETYIKRKRVNLATALRATAISMDAVLIVYSGIKTNPTW